MNVAYINPFINSLVTTFNTMMKQEIKPGKLYIKSTRELTYDVSGIIGLSGSAQGTVVLSFPKVVALKVVSSMLGMEIKIVGPEVSDAIGELANIVAGYAKQGLAQFNLSISLPSVVIGKNHSVASLTQSPFIVIPFTSPFGEFAMEVSLKTE